MPRLRIGNYSILGRIYEQESLHVGYRIFMMCECSLLTYSNKITAK